MATATKTARAPRRPTRDRGGAAGSASMEFRIDEDNGGGYHWTIVARGGESLVQSPSFASYEDAEHAARVVRDGAGSARFGFQPGAERAVDLSARRELAAARESSEAGRWLDDGGGLISEAVALWPAGR
jgi:uncharacterized protein YegP (UPF0339 family)